ncbi:hypothetical protein MYSTI_03271 [Myxococcus stipitatus DSM 14675]|uniref:Uncharacterized protein n=1 Tax=Myxococcus stipitatus (strain DSM 14675 / JCM 12634 / Mx s8) TaxID=1278073 RepID=L7U904_MYXSD|nr:hypothetical protein [Myxococcus stipitatus]AGC44583.1 hypothetical protein MYSTI_03271 [Myxococcus stipitatus DSM 14675]
MVKLTGQSPDAVRGWAWDDVVHLLALCDMEAEELRAGRPHVGARAGAPQVTVYRKRPKR